MAQFPTAKDIYLEVDGRRLAAAQSYRVTGSRETRFVESFGAAAPAAAVAGVPRYTVELSRLRITGEETDFYGLENFTVVIVKPDRKILYTGCQWADIVEEAGGGDPVSETLTAYAAGRMEVAL